MARLEMTSFTFMLVCVPLPVCQMRKRELVVQLAGDDFVGGLHDELRLVGGKFAQILIHQRAGLLQDAEGANQLRRHGVAPDVEMQQRALRLRAPVDIRGDFDLPHAVGFDAGARRVRRT